MIQICKINIIILQYKFIKNNYIYFYKNITVNAFFIFYAFYNYSHINVKHMQVSQPIYYMHSSCHHNGELCVFIAQTLVEVDMLFFT